MVTKSKKSKNPTCFLKKLKNGQKKCPKTEIPRPTLGYFSCFFGEVKKNLSKH
jgi:hypothetical protein